MFIKAVGISIVIASCFVGILLIMDAYVALAHQYKQIINGIVVFVALVATVYAILWLDKNPMPSDFPRSGDEDD